MSEPKIDYIEQDIYEYFGANEPIALSDKYTLLAIIGGMSGILELLWHKQVTPEQVFSDFKEFLKYKQELANIHIEVKDDD